MRKLIALILCFVFPTVAMAFEPSNTYKVAYDGGSLIGIKAGGSAVLVVSEKQIQIVKGKEIEIVSIPVGSVTEISYGQDVHRRIGAAIGVAIFTLGIGALLALTKSKKHFIGLAWVNGDKKGGFAMQCDKNEYRGILNGLEGVTGKKAVDSEAMTVKN